MNELDTQERIVSWANKTFFSTKTFNEKEFKGQIVKLHDEVSELGDCVVNYLKNPVMENTLSDDILFELADIYIVLCNLLAQRTESVDLKHFPEMVNMEHTILRDLFRQNNSIVIDVIDENLTDCECEEKWEAENLPTNYEEDILKIVNNKLFWSAWDFVKYLIQSEMLEFIGCHGFPTYLNFDGLATRLLHIMNFSSELENPHAGRVIPIRHIVIETIFERFYKAYKCSGSVILEKLDNFIRVEPNTLLEYVNRKMDINIARKWEKTAGGKFQHVKE